MIPATFQPAELTAGILPLAVSLLDQFGEEATYGSYNPKVVPTLDASFNSDQTQPIDQQAIRESRRLTIYKVKVVFGDELRSRQSGALIPASSLTATFTTKEFCPKAGDWLETPTGKRYPVTLVEVLAPQGYPILYTVTMTDGG